MGPESIEPKRLTRDEFASAIQKGLGRAMLHVLHYGIDDVEDLVLDACLHNYTYDIQCENGRDEWLLEMICKTPRYETFRAAILEHLETETELDDLDQLCDLAFQMAAENGDTAAREALWACAFRIAETSKSGWGRGGPNAWVHLEGISAFIELARVFGRRLLADPSDTVPDWLHSMQTEESTRQVLRDEAAKSPEIKAYYDFLKSHGSLDAHSDKREDRDAYRRRMREEYSLQRVLREARNKVGTRTFEYSFFGKYAKPNELRQVYDLLLRETDPDVQLRLLWAFARTPLPELNDIFFAWAEGPDEELRRASIRALSHTRDERVHSLAVSKVRHLQLSGADNDSLDLFLNNYGSGDGDLITQALESLHPNRDDAHRLILDLINIAEQNKDPEWVPALLWSYENTPCCECRESVIRRLIRLEWFTDAMRHECLYDADEDIREIAKTGEVTE